LHAPSLAKKTLPNSDPGSSSKSKKTNPFLPYDAELFVCELSPTHVLLLNKFPVVENHVLVVTKGTADRPCNPRARIINLNITRVQGTEFAHGGFGF
jgi:ATP adenylyltransferase/5',5'''-P-1,P-4-tetraphosphate phosphorylase II